MQFVESHSKWECTPNLILQCFLNLFVSNYNLFLFSVWIASLLLAWLCRRKQDEVAVLEDTIRMRSEQQKKAGVELEATCHICLKTKFADGIGHVCHYCNIRCCARCGGKVTLRSNKVCDKIVISIYYILWYFNVYHYTEEDAVKKQ